MKKHYKNEIEDFQVKEIIVNNLNLSLLEDKKYKNYLLTKKGFSTFDAIDMLAKEIKININEIGYAGLKDEDGITQQSISINSEVKVKDCFLTPLSLYTKDGFVALKFIGYLKEKIEIGELLGNSFRIVLRNLSKETVEKIYKSKKIPFLFFNYYDTQRFGLPNKRKITHLIGKALLKNNIKKALRYINQNENKKFEYIDEINPRKLSFYKNSYSSYLWNKELVNLIEKKGSANKNFYSKGFKFVFIKEQADVAKVYQEEKIEYISYREDNTIKSSNRPVILQTLITVPPQDNFEDDIFKNNYKITIEFFLPSGTYATILLKQFLYTHL